MNKVDDYKRIRNFLFENYALNTIDIKALGEGVTGSLLVVTTQKRYVLKAIIGPFKETMLDSLKVLRYLETKNYPSPKVILSNKGKLYETNQDGVSYVLYSYIDGNEIGDHSDYHTIGHLLGKLHKEMKEYDGNLMKRSKIYYYTRYINILKKKSYNLQRLKEYVEMGEFYWDKVKTLETGYCHGDLHLGNLLINDSKALSIVDFDTSCNSFVLFDIMVVCNNTDYFEFKESDFDQTISNYYSLIESYKSYCDVSLFDVSKFCYLLGLYHFQLQATIVEIYGIDCIDHAFIDSQLNWLKEFKTSC